ncbi:MAG: DNA-processing protein DprA [bacterium]|nr:DNA-processing protein DprA [bacterium]
MRQDISAWLTLRTVPGIGDIRFRYLIDVFGSPEAVLSANKSALVKVNGISEHLATAIINHKHEYRPEEELALAKQNGVDIITYLDAEYPQRLRTIPDYPVLLYIQGKVVADDVRAVAIVGSRRATIYGGLIARKFAQDLVAAGATVVSGFARGIDTEAHLGAIDAGGRTIAVVGNGLSVCYPRENRGLRERIISSGCMISEFPMLTPPHSDNFPKRNRIISGLCLGVVIIEATDTSGALLTAQHALDQNRLVFAVPGNITTPTSRGTNRLIQQGAKLVVDVNDILIEFGFSIERTSIEKKPGSNLNSLSAEKQKIISLLSAEPLHIDQISVATSFSPAKLAQFLLELELQGLIRELSGKRYVRIV